jgi:HAD superfamily hydrolase (TIGR01490 family)
VIREGLAGKSILVTGSTGFLGKSIVEKVLWSLPEVQRVNLAIRSSARRSAVERLEREVLSSPAFRRLREREGEEGWKRLVAEKLRVIEVDLGRDGLGLDDAGREQLRSTDVVIHSAAAVEFDNPADLSAQTNLLGAARLTETVREAAVGHLVHISTAYVGGLLRGVVREELPHDPGLNWRHEASVIANLRPAVEEESRSPEVLAQLMKQARSRMGPAGTPAVARLVERLRDRWVKDRLIERGRVHARAMGFADIYSFTKAMAERAVVELHGELPVSIVRPSIIESALAEPFPGWLEGFRMAEPILLAYGRRVLEDFPGLADSVLDVIPVDFVVNTVIAAAAAPPPRGEHRIYHAASGSRNSLGLRRLEREGEAYFVAHPLRDRYGQAIGPPRWEFPPRAEVEGRAKRLRALVDGLQYVVERLPFTGLADVSDQLNETRDRLDRVLGLLQLYGVYTEVDVVFDTAHTMELWERIPAGERKDFPLDPALFDWSHYWQEVHLPTVVRMARAETAARRGRQPRGSTEPAAERDLGVEQVRRRAGRSDVLAVFDVDGTLVETNVIEYFIWMRLKAQPLRAWPRFLAGLAAEGPRWLQLERHSRAEFQRSFYRQYRGLDYEEMRDFGREAMNEVTLRRLYPEGVRRIREHRQAGHRVLLLTGALDVVVDPLAAMLEVELDCAHLVVDADGVITGDLAAPPPAGEARATLLDRYAKQNGIEISESFAYADSLSDLPMLELVGNPVAVNPDARLSAIARQRGWRVERWTMPPGNWRLPVPDPRSKTYREQFV